MKTENAAFLKTKSKGITKTAENVVEVVEVIIAFFHYSFVPNGDVDLSVGFCHCAGAERKKIHGRKIG